MAREFRRLLGLKHAASGSAARCRRAISALIGVWRSLGKVAGRVSEITQLEYKADRWQMTPLALNIEHFAVAASLAMKRCDSLRRPLGDGLVAPRGALGDHRDPARSLGIPATNRLLVPGIGHLQLLGHPEVSAFLKRWLAPDRG